MKKIISTMLASAMLMPTVSVFAESKDVSDSNIVMQSESSSDITQQEYIAPNIEEILKIVDQQLDAQNASPESYEIFHEFVKREYGVIDNSSATPQAANSTVIFKKGGDITYDMYNGSLYAGHIEKQLLPPTMTQAIIDKKLYGNLTTWGDVLAAVSGFVTSYFFPVIGTIIGAYGVLGTIDKYTSAETIRAITNGGGASQFVAAKASGGQNLGWDVVWVPWYNYPYEEIPSGSYYKNVQYHVTQ